MKRLTVNQAITLSIFVMMVLICGFSGIGYGNVCQVGDVLSPGESCTDPGPGDTFSVLANGSGRYLFITAGTGINLRGNINGKQRNFLAEKRADGKWEIKSVTGGGAPQTPIQEPEPGREPDLVVTSVRVSDTTVSPGERFTLSATLRNRGTGASTATTLRYYRSSNNSISANDTQVGTDSVSRLGANRTGDESISLSAPTSPGTYYYGACVDTVTDESDTGNNCSNAVRVIVQAPVRQKPDLVIEAAQAVPATVEPGATFRLYATLKNSGTGDSTTTTLRYYRSTDRVITTRDTQLGRGNRDPLAPNATLRRYLEVTAPTTPGTYYYGACVDTVTNESDTTNNCSTAVRVTVNPQEVTPMPVRGTTVRIHPASITSPAVGGRIEVALNIVRGEAVAGYQATLQFDTTALRYISSANGDFLPAGAFFAPPVVKGNRVKLSSASLAGERNGDGTLATLTFAVIARKASTLTLSDVLLSSRAGETSGPQIQNAAIAEPTRPKEDVNGDGTVNIDDLVLVARRYRQRGRNSADVNGDNIVNIADLIAVAAVIDANAAAAPSLHPDTLETLTSADVRLWLSEARHLKHTDVTTHRGVLFLEQLLVALIPKDTALLANYPNPFNPETWIPYQLAKDAEVTLTIYGVNGHVVRRLGLGHQPAGIYQERSRAAYWDGKNAFGEPVASGLYFYTLTTGDFTATRKLLIRK